MVNKKGVAYLIIIVIIILLVVGGVWYYSSWGNGNSGSGDLSNIIGGDVDDDGESVPDEILVPDELFSIPYCICHNGKPGDEYVTRDICEWEGCEWG